MPKKCNENSQRHFKSVFVRNEGGKDLLTFGREITDWGEVMLITFQLSKIKKIIIRKENSDQLFSLLIITNQGKWQLKFQQTLFWLSIMKKSRSFSLPGQFP